VVRGPQVEKRCYSCFHTFRRVRNISWLDTADEYVVCVVLLCNGRAPLFVTLSGPHTGLRTQWNSQNLEIQLQCRYVGDACVLVANVESILCLIRITPWKRMRTDEASIHFHSSVALQPFVEPWPLLQFRNLSYTDGRTPRTSDQPVARPLPTHKTTQTQNKHTKTSMSFGF
jgi:hypothetical protein